MPIAAQRRRTRRANAPLCGFLCRHDAPCFFSLRRALMKNGCFRHRRSVPDNPVDPLGILLIG
jgi:hypothetical protein